MNFKEKKISQDKYKISVEDKSMSAIIELEYSPNHKEELYKIIFYWNDTYQDTKYADTLEIAKEKAKTLLQGMTKQLKYMKTFESFSKLYEFNKKDINILKNIGNHFTISYEFELETDDEKLEVPENEEQIVVTIKTLVMEQLTKEKFPFTEKTIDKILQNIPIYPDDYEGDENYIALVVSEIYDDEMVDFGEESDDDEIDNFLSYGEKQVEKYLPNFYDKYHNDLKFEIDNTLNRGIEFSPKTYIVSLNEGIKMLELFYNDFEKQKYWKMNDKTSIHINIGLTDKNHVWNLAKGIIMLKDYDTNKIPYVYKDMEYRQDTLFTKSLIEPVKKHFIENKPEKFVVEEIEQIINDIVEETFKSIGTKTYAINMHNIMKYDYAEFRYIGGEVTKEIVLNKLMFFCYIVYLMTSDYKEQDYHKKLYKFVYDSL